MNETFIPKIAEESGLRAAQVQAVCALLAEGATVPFIARYRKEATGSLDEVAITSIRDRMAKLEELGERRNAVLKSLEERELLTDELRARLEAAETLSTLEDIYLPFRPKRRTRAMVAREKGLEPLAQLLLAQEDFDVDAAAGSFVSPEKGVATVEEALAGARDILAEMANEDAQVRAEMRELFLRTATVRSRVVEGKEKEGIKYRDYYEWEEPLAEAPSHRILAMRRGENEQVLTLALRPPEEPALAILENRFLKAANSAADQVHLALHDSYKRLLAPSMGTEIRAVSKTRADQEAIRVFAENLRQLLLAAPLGRKRVMAVDPGIRTGCKLVCLDPQGKLLHHDVIFPLLGDREKGEAAAKVEALCRNFGIEAIAVGNGTGGRETEAFLRAADLPARPLILAVNESGASVYSASEAAREEFPDEDVTVRGAVSIGRRLQDPLAELVKIDPKSIGVGQYQHDVDQSELRASLDDVVMSCVNAVGVEVNTASRQLLSYVSGLGPQLARNIVEHRNANGPFHSREQLRKVPRLGPKAFEQCAGFLRIRDGENPLDASAVHPESYSVVEAMAADQGCGVEDLIRVPEARRRINLEQYVTEKTGLPTLNDILEELAKPGRDPRQDFEPFQFAEDVTRIEDLSPGMRLPGRVTNLTRFGAFVDIGVHQDGLIHVSQLADRFVRDPAEVVKLGQAVTVTVLEVDSERRRISLSMRGNSPKSPALRTRSEDGRDSGASDRPGPEPRKSRAEQRGREPTGAEHRRASGIGELAPERSGPAPSAKSGDAELPGAESRQHGTGQGAHGRSDPGQARSRERGGAGQKPKGKGGKPAGRVDRGSKPAKPIESKPDPNNPFVKALQNTRWPRS